MFAGALAAALMAGPNLARAQGLLDFLFKGFHRDEPASPAYAEPGAPSAMAPERRDNVIGGGGGGRYVAFCVRLCDGQHFPLDHNASATPVETCRAMCPTAKTKIFFGTEIDRAAARDGTRYADLESAFVYRQRLVANCTCNGRDAFGLSHIDPRTDPTLRPGDIVVTANGPMAYIGRRDGHVANFTPVDPATLGAGAGLSPRMRFSERSGYAPPQGQSATVEADVEVTGGVRDQADR